MELKITTTRALAYEERTGVDVLDTLGEISTQAEKGRMPKLKQVLAVFATMGEDYNAQKFDEWDVPLVEKITQIAEAAKEYIVGKNAPAVSKTSSKGAIHSGLSQKK